jgi:general stress protein 26
MNPTSEIIPETYDIEDSADILGIAKGLVNGQHPGILCTVDGNGIPHVRWMSTLNFDEFPIFHTLTAPHSRKVIEIKEHPDVTWMFFNQDMTLVLNLTGTARVLTDPRTCKRIWKKVEDKSHAYFLDQFGKTEGFVVVETKVDRIECTNPKSSLRFEIEAEELKRA